MKKGKKTQEHKEQRECIKIDRIVEEAHKNAVNQIKKDLRASPTLVIRNLTSS